MVGESEVGDEKLIEVDSEDSTDISVAPEEGTDSELEGKLSTINESISSPGGVSTLVFSCNKEPTPCCVSLLELLKCWSDRTEASKMGGSSTSLRFLFAIGEELTLPPLDGVFGRLDVEVLLSGAFGLEGVTI